MDTSSLNRRHRPKTKLFKYQIIDKKEKKIKNQIQNSSIYHGSKIYLSQ